MSHSKLETAVNPRQAVTDLLAEIRDRGYAITVIGRERTELPSEILPLYETLLKQLSLEVAALPSRIKRIRENAEKLACRLEQEEAALNSVVGQMKQAIHSARKNLEGNAGPARP